MTIITTIDACYAIHTDLDALTSEEDWLAIEYSLIDYDDLAPFESPTEDRPEPRLFRPSEGEVIF